TTPPSRPAEAPVAATSPAAARPDDGGLPSATDRDRSPAEAAPAYNAREGMDAVHPGELMMPPSAVSVPPPGVALHDTVTPAHTAVTDTLRDGAHEATRNAAREHLTSERTAVRESLTAERRLA